MGKKTLKKRRKRPNAKQMAARRAANMGSFSVKGYVGDAYGQPRKSLAAELLQSSLKRMRLIAIVFGTALALTVVSWSFIDTGSEWYMSLDNPLRPMPGYVFAICWGVCFMLMGACCVLIAKGGKTLKLKHAVTLGLSGLLGCLWVMLIFFSHLAANALLVSVALAGILLVFELRLFKSHPYAAWVLAPCGIWMGVIIAFGYYIAMFN